VTSSLKVESFSSLGKCDDKTRVYYGEIPDLFGTGMWCRHEGPWRLALKRLGSIGFTDYDHNNQAQNGDQV
jgi:hypothetical protein